MSVTEADLKLYVGIDNRLRMTIEQEDPSDPNSDIPLDTTGWTIEFIVKKIRSDAAAELSLTSAVVTEIEDIDSSEGIWDVIASAAATADMTPGRRVLFVQGTDASGLAHVIHDGSVTVLHGPTVA